MVGQYSKWVAESDGPLILDFEILLPAVPQWLLAYSTAEPSCLHRIVATLKVRGSQSQYRNFIGDLCKSLTPIQCCSLEKVFFPFSKTMLN